MQIFIKILMLLSLSLLLHECEGENLLVCLLVLRQVHKKETLWEQLIFFFPVKPCLRQHLKCCLLTLLNHLHNNIYLKSNTKNSLCYLKNGYASLCQVLPVLYHLPWNESPNLMVKHRLLPKLISAKLIWKTPLVEW